MTALTSLTYASPFPADFLFGVAAAAPQIEGAAFEDGKGESIWDRFCRQPGAVHDGDTLDAGLFELLKVVHVARQICAHGSRSGELWIVPGVFRA